VTAQPGKAPVNLAPASQAQCLISFGSNLGLRAALIADAAQIIASSSLVHDLKASRLFETPPIGGPAGQEPFLNAVAAFDTEASARKILDLLQETEQRLGRTRDLRWDSRVIDLDVVLHGELVGGGTGLTVPHPRYTARQFVLQPACDVAANYRDPRFGWTLERLTGHLNEGLPSLALVGGDAQIRRQLLEQLRHQNKIETLFEQPVSLPMPMIGNAPASRHRDDAAESQIVPESISRPWVSGFLPQLPESTDVKTRSNNIPRLVARIERTTPETCWPAPHQMWPAGWQWPEYRLEVDDIEWAAGEIESALCSMRCPVQPVTEDGNWWN
jgi:2-amino-4-hydroxy-6-hydroxymethyldihydropteridine diphosphokinase